MRFNTALEGEDLKIKNRKVQFSFWPMGKGKKHEKLHSTLFVSDPWQVIEQRVRQAETNFQLQTNDDQSTIQALHFLRQSKDFYKAMEDSDTQAAKPLLLYYCFLNLAKCFVIFKKRAILNRHFSHGIEAYHDEALIKVARKPEKINGNKRGSAFRLFAEALGAPIQGSPFKIPMDNFLSQILVGHRVYCQSQGTKFKEKFISLEEMHFKQDRQNKKIWLLARTARHDFDRIDQKIGDLAGSLSHKNMNWENVNETNTEYGREYIFAQLKAPVSYSRKPSSVLNKLCKDASHRLWRSATSYPPYRKYYIYIPSYGEELLHQLLSIYLATFYFGSITRYNPVEFDALLKSEMGPFIHQFFNSQPSQFLYLMASEFMEQEVAKGAVI